MIKITKNFHMRRSGDNRCWELFEGFSGYKKSGGVKCRTPRYYTDMKYLIESVIDLETGIRSAEVETLQDLAELYRTTRDEITSAFSIFVSPQLPEVSMPECMAENTPPVAVS